MRTGSDRCNILREFGNHRFRDCLRNFWTTVTGRSLFRRHGCCMVFQLLVSEYFKNVKHSKFSCNWRGGSIIASRSLLMGLQSYVGMPKLWIFGEWKQRLRLGPHFACAGDECLETDHRDRSRYKACSSWNSNPCEANLP